MSKNNKYNKVSSQTQDEAMKMAKATQRPSQTKEQTKLIAQGIEKGINLYKKKHKVKARGLNKKMQKVSQQLTELEKGDDEVATNTIVKQSLLPWVLLAISWVGFIAFVLLY